jgi:IS5 family transposase
VALRLLVLKHLYPWSFADCEREGRGSLIYRAFCRLDGERVPEAKTLIRRAQALGPEVLKKVLERLVQGGRQRRVVRGRKLRVDTTVVETNIHHPTDSSLLGDGVRVITRTLHKIRRTVGPRRFRDRTRSVARRVFAIAERSRKLGEEAQAGRKQLYRQLMGTTRAVLRQAARAVVSAKRRAPKLALRLRPRVQGLCRQVKQMSELTPRVLEQTRARVLKGDTHYPGKGLSVFAPHTEAIRKGKKLKPTEFGKLVKIQEAEAQFITDYEVCGERLPHGKLWEPSLARHEQLFGRPPHLATADAAFASAANEKAATERGVRGVALPRYGRVSASPSAARLVSTGAALADGMRGADQRSQTTARALALPLSRRIGDGTLGGSGGTRQQPAGAGPSPSGQGSEAREEIRRSTEGMESKAGIRPNDRGDKKPRMPLPI